MLRYMLDTNLCIRVLRDRPQSIRERFNAILIERESEYVADIRRRLARLGGADTPLFGSEVA